MASVTNKREIGPSERWREFANAVENEDIKTIKQLCQRPGTLKLNPLEIATTLKKVKSMETLLKMQVNPSKSSGPNLNTPLHIAALGDNLPGVNFCLAMALISKNLTYIAIQLF